jgi:uncharacterized membrane protein YeiB
MAMETDRRGARGPVRRAERALAPDLARGSMLLLIALANIAGVVFSGAPGADLSPHGLERAVNLLMFTLVDARAYPAFAIMFGYGLVQLSNRQLAAGASEGAVRTVLLRRNAWLVAFGFAHATLLYFGDFLGAYGIVGIVMTLLVLRRGERVHRIALLLWALSLAEVLVLGALLARAWRGSSGTGTVATEHINSFSAPSYGQSMHDRLAEWPAHTLTVLPFIMIVWLGALAARRRVLEQPSQHLTLLRWTAVVGLGIAILGGLPIALLSAGTVQVDASTASLMSLLAGVAGMFAGPGYLAVFGLLAHRLMRTGRGPVVLALCALGQRSLSGYLFQSAAWLVLLAPYTLALGHRFGSPTYTALVLGALLWLASVFIASQLDRRGCRGPAEVLLRRLTYGPTSSRHSAESLANG